MTLGFAASGSVGLLARSEVIAARERRRDAPHRPGRRPPRGVRQRGHRARSCPATGAPRSSGSSSAWRPEHPALAFHEVRYRVKSWKHLDCASRTPRAALDAVADRRAAGAAARLLDGRRGLDRGRRAPVGERRWSAWRPGSRRASTWAACAAGASPSSRARSTARLPGIPGVSPRSSRAGFERVHDAGGRGRLPAHPRRRPPHRPARRGERLVPAPRAATWARLVGGELARFQAEEGGLTAARCAMRAAPAPSRPTPGPGAPAPGWSTSSRPPDAGPGRGSPSPGRRGGCCASPRRRWAAPRASCCGSRRRSRTRGVPNVWQTELTLQVMWWNRKIRTSPPHTMPVRPPRRSGPRRSRRRTGCASVRTTQSM